MEEVVFPEFIFLRPIFIAFIVALVLLLFVIMLQRKYLINGFSLVFILLICLVTSAVTLFASGFIVDEYNLAGDEQSFYMFLIIVGLCIINYIVYVMKGLKRKRGK